jgi:hypothetical protein
MASHAPRKPPPAQRWDKIAPYVALSLGSFLCALVVLVFFLWNPDKLVALGLSGNFYYIILLPLGLSVAAFLFGALRAYASYKGKLFGGVLQLGGPAVAFFLVIVLGFQLPPPATNLTLTVYVHGSGGPQDLTLRGTGTVRLDTGGLRRPAPIDSNGQAVFTEIPANFRGQEATVGLDSEGYELANPNQKIRLDSNSVYVGVRKKAGRIAGRVEDEKSAPIRGVRITVSGLTALTNSDGWFELSIPSDRVQPNLTLQAVVAGYAIWSDIIVPNSNEITITLHKR